MNPSRHKLRPFLFVFIIINICLNLMGSRILQEKETTLITQIINELQTKIPEWLNASDVPGAAVAVFDDKNILWKEVYGHTSRNNGILLNPETIFSIQSMSKSFTALGVLMAVQEELLDLDVPITEYLPDFTVNSIHEKHPEQKITLRHLLAHRAGFTHEAPVGGNFDSRPHTFKEHILSISDTWLRYPVGYRNSYSNLGIDLAGYILEKKSSIPFWKYIQEKILIPLDMTKTTLNFDEIKKVNNRALGHVASRVEIQDGIPVDIPMIPAGGVYTNILDMAKYLQFHLNKGSVNGKQLLRKDLLEQMFSPSFPEKNQRSGYGLCLSRDVVSSTYFLSHGGGGYGFITFMVVYPELKLGVVSLTNSEISRFSGGQILSVANRLIEENMGPRQPWPVKPEIDINAPLSPEDEKARNIMGLYDQNIKVEFRDEIFGISLRNDFYPMQLYLDGDNVKGTFGQYSEVWFKPPLFHGQGTMVHLNRYSGSCSYYDFHKPDGAMDTPGPNKTEWKKYCGVYKALKWGRTFGQFLRVDIKDGYLTLNTSRCFEYLPGLFFTFNGEALDFRGTIATFRNILLIKRK